MTKHTHRAVTTTTTCFTGPVADPGRESPEAHGGITEVSHCRCGASRRTNINGGHRECGGWVVPYRPSREEVYEEWAEEWAAKKRALQVAVASARAAASHIPRYTHTSGCIVWINLEDGYIEVVGPGAETVEERLGLPPDLAAAALALRRALVALKGG